MIVSGIDPIKCRLQEMKHSELIKLLIETVKDELLGLQRRGSDDQFEETKTPLIERPIDQ